MASGKILCKRVGIILAVILIIFLLGPMYVLLSGQVKLGQNWRTANRASSGALNPYGLQHQAAIVLLDAPAFNWRGMFSVHTWLATKVANSQQYTVYQVLGWNRWRRLPYVNVSFGAADHFWFGYRPEVVSLVTGKKAVKLIPNIRQAVRRYPYADRYWAWPGPNSNTFIGYILQQVPQLGMQMPYNALGRDFTPQFHWPDFSLWGIFGYHLSANSFYINFLGLNLGLSWQPKGFIIPGLGFINL